MVLVPIPAPAEDHPDPDLASSHTERLPVHIAFEPVLEPAHAADVELVHAVEDDTQLHLFQADTSWEQGLLQVHKVCIVVTASWQMEAVLEGSQELLPLKVRVYRNLV